MGLPYAIPAGRFGVVVLDQLAAGERQASYRALLALLALDDDPQTRSFLEHRLGAEQIGRGRWREGARPRPGSRAATGGRWPSSSGSETMPRDR